MKNTFPLFLYIITLCQAYSQSCQENNLRVRNTEGLVAFWDFENKNLSTNNFIAYSNIS